MTPWTDYAAVLFDLDGVLTMTMKVHAACWKRMFDAYLRERSATTGAAFVPFDIIRDYKEYVDGRLRYDGVRNFLASRRIRLAEGSPDDPPGRETVCGLGNRKDRMVNEVISAEGVEVLAGSLKVVHHLRKIGLKTAVVSASRNCRTVLKAAGIEELFEVVVDGEVAARLGLPGKPQPDTYLEAARELGVLPSRTVVVEDAVAGVRAGESGGFALIIGIDHHDDPTSLFANGAHLVVRDLSQLLPA